MATSSQQQVNDLRTCRRLLQSVFMNGPNARWMAHRRRVAMLGMRAASRLRAALADTASDRHAWMAVFLVCLPAYLLFAHYSIGSVDTQSAVLPAWQLVHHGNLWVEHVHPRVYWSVPVGHHLVSNRTLGVELVNVPYVALLYWLGPSMVPGALTAATMTAGTVAFLFLVFRRLVSRRTAIVATLFMAFGTSLWTVAAAEVWPHTVDAFCIAISAYALSQGRWWMAGVSLGAGVLARPHVAVIALVVGLGLGWACRSLRPVFGVGVPAAMSLIAVELWNSLLYGSASVSGGYAGYARANLTQASGSSLRFVATNVAGFLISPQRGLFIFLPLAVLLLFGMRSAWRSSEPWIRALAIGGLAYTLVQLKINGFGGGDAFFGSRLSTELIVCAAPLALVCVRSWVLVDARRTRWTRALAVLSISIQAVGAATFSIPASSPPNPWHASPIWDAMTARPVATIALLWWGLATALWLLRRDPPGLETLRGRLRGGRAAAAPSGA